MTSSGWEAKVGAAGSSFWCMKETLAKEVDNRPEKLVVAELSYMRGLGRRGQVREMERAGKGNKIIAT